MIEQYMDRPWGVWLTLHAGKGYKVKKLIVHPEQHLSKQYHNHRDEHWVVLSGNGVCYVEYTDPFIPSKADIFLFPGMDVKIPKKTIHCLHNTSKTDDLVIIEIQTGDVCDEEDIVRLDE